ncbi:MAG: hypothetical protein K9G76_01290 [Bacteroidales bacterium]|nr:hypothetical protein [Bacteroidales bacterium]MCF8403186.1 hypothetical protein [Bacteroidales bacterium]
MKKFIKVSTLVIGLSIFPLIMFAQNPPHPNGGSGPTGGNTPVGGGAPLDGGLLTLVVLGSAYALKNTIRFKAE